jgi:uncharacterized protein (DUF1810 family)
VDAQQRTYSQALAEIRSGQKRSHWMWFIFPQIRGLAVSAMSERYAIRSAAEARAYLEHPMLGARLVECCEAVIGLEDRTPFEIFGYPDELKLKSCATLFAAVAPAGSVFARLLDACFGGERDDVTVQLLARH